MRCYECGGEIIRKETSFVMYDQRRQPIFFEHVAVAECGQCGERYLDSAMVERVQAVLDKGVEKAGKEIRVPVVTFAA